MLTEINGKYIVGLSSDDYEFTNYSDQHVKTMINIPLREIFKISKEMINILKDWKNKYNPIFIGSNNKEKTHKYKKILQKVGIDSGSVMNNGVNYFFQINEHKIKISKKFLMNI